MREERREELGGGAYIVARDDWGGAVRVSLYGPGDHLLGEVSKAQGAGKYGVSISGRFEPSMFRTIGGRLCTIAERLNAKGPAALALQGAA